MVPAYLVLALLLLYIRTNKQITTERAAVRRASGDSMNDAAEAPRPNTNLVHLSLLARATH